MSNKLATCARGAVFLLAAAGLLPATGKALEKEGTETSGSKSPEDFAAFLAEDAKLWARLVKDSGVKAD